MKTLRELCKELWEKTKVSQKKVASDLGISLATFKGYVYKGIKPKNPEDLKKIRRYLRREIKKGAPMEKVQRGIAKTLRDMAYEIGGGDITAGVEIIRKEMKIPESSFNNWYYKRTIPQKKTLKELASYFTKKLGRKITEEFLLGKEVEKAIEPKIEEVKKVEKVKEEKPKEEPKEALIETAERLISMIKSYVKEEKIALSSEEIDFLNKFRTLSEDAKKGLMLFLDNVGRGKK